MTPFPRIVTPLLAVWCLCAGIAVAEEENGKKFSADQLKMHKEVTELVVAQNTGDAKTVSKFMHPQLVKARFGSQEELERQLAIVKKSVSQFESLLGVKMNTKVDFTENITFVKSKEHEFAIIPMTMTIMAPTSLQVDAFVLGIRDDPKSDWKYVDGAAFESKKVQDYFPDFPKDQRLPKIKLQSQDDPAAAQELLDALTDQPKPQQ